MDRRNGWYRARKNRRIVIWSLGVAVLGLGGILTLGGCPTAGQPGANEVFMRSIAFEPAEITITAGESVTWRNTDIVPHTATSGNPGDADLGSVFQSSAFGLGGTFSHTFTEPGEFVYFCEVHPVMMRDAKVIVVP